MPRRGAFWGFEMKREMARGPVASEPAQAVQDRRIPDDLPEIPRSLGKKFRVCRMEFPEGRPAEFRWPVIWETSIESEAMRVAMAQKYRARMICADGKHFDNGAPAKAVADAK